MTWRREGDYLLLKEHSTPPDTVKIVELTGDRLQLVAVHWQDSFTRISEETVNLLLLDEANERIAALRRHAKQLVAERDSLRWELALRDSERTKLGASTKVP